MLYLDYSWDLNPSGIVLDDELDVNKIGWKSGDYFRLEVINGNQMLVKVGDVEKFLIQGAKKDEQVSRMVG